MSGSGSGARAEVSRIAVCAGSFDPFTEGHLDVLRRGLTMFDRIIVAVAHNPKKQATFSVEERVRLIEESIVEAGDRVEVDTFEGLVVNYAKRRGAVALLRGLRAVSDFEFEFQMASMNRKLAPELQTVFLMAAEDHFYVSSSLVKEVAGMGGDVSSHVPPPVARALANLRSDQEDSAS
jgi:pantetheine-phosphate adenylyltransferase